MGVPKVLPADFSGFDEDRAPTRTTPATLPANFNGFDEDQTEPPIVSRTPITPRTPTPPAPQPGFFDRARTAVRGFANDVSRVLHPEPEVIGSAVPEAAVPALETANKYLVQPFDYMAQKGAEAGRWANKPIGPSMTDQELQAAHMERNRPPAWAKGANEALAETAGSMLTDPRNWPFFASAAARPLLQRMISGGFAAMQGRDAITTANYLAQHWDEITPEERSKLATQGGLGALFATLSAAHAVSGTPEIKAEPEAVEEPTVAPEISQPAEISQPRRPARFVSSPTGAVLDRNAITEPQVTIPDQAPPTIPPKPQPKLLAAPRRFVASPTGAVLDREAITEPEVTLPPELAQVPTFEQPLALPRKREPARFVAAPTGGVLDRAAVGEPEVRLPEENSQIVQNGNFAKSRPRLLPAAQVAAPDVPGEGSVEPQGGPQAAGPGPAVLDAEARRARAQRNEQERLARENAQQPVGEPRVEKVVESPQAERSVQPAPAPAAATQEKIDEPTVISQKPKGRRTAQDYLNEPIEYGGETKTRGEVIADLKANGATQPEIDRYMQGTELRKRIAAEPKVQPAAAESADKNSEIGSAPSVEPVTSQKAPSTEVEKPEVEPKVVAPGTETPDRLESMKTELADLEKRLSARSASARDTVRAVEIRRQIREAEVAARTAGTPEVKPADADDLPDPKRNKFAYQREYFTRSLEPVREAWKTLVGDRYEALAKKPDLPTSSVTDAKMKTTVTEHPRPGAFPDEYIRIDIPEDGKFKVRNTPYAIEKLLKSAPRAFAKPRTGVEAGRDITPTRAPKEFDNAKYVAGLEKEITQLESETKYGGAKADYAREQLRAARENLAEAKRPPTQEPAVESPEETPAPKKKGTKLYSGAAIFDPDAWREIFPTAFERLKNAVSDKLSPGELSKGILRQVRGVLDQRKEQMYSELEGERNRWQKKSAEDSRGFIGAIEGGKIDEIADPHDRKLAGRLRDELDKRRDYIQSRGWGLRDFIEDYFPHVWENPAKARKVFQQILGSKRPFQGPASFLKQRTIDTFEAGIERGLKPVTYNPVDLAMLKMHEMDRFIMSREAMDLYKRTAADVTRQEDPKALRLATFAEVNTTREKLLQKLGWKKYEDRVGTVYGPNHYDVPEWYDKNIAKALKQVNRNLGIEHQRGLEPIERHPEAMGVSYTGQSRIRTRANTPLSVWAHETMHQLDDRYGFRDRLPKTGFIKKELRQLSDLTYEGADPSIVPDSFKRYVRSKAEKMAHVLEMYVADRGRLRSEFPHTYDWLKRFIDSTPELEPLRDLKGGIAYSERINRGHIRGQVILGHYWGPPDAVDVFNRNLSPGLAGRNRAYDIYRGAANTLNAAQLGLSAYHAGFTSFDAAVSDVALGIEKISRGDFKGAAMPAARGFSFASAAQTVLNGDKVIKEYLKPGSFKDYAQTARAIAVAGGRIKMDPFYRNESIRGFQTAMKDGRYAQAAKRAVPAFFEAASKPIMEWLVPHQKLGVFHKMVSDVFDRAKREQWDDVKIRNEVQKAWDSVDNRLGQMVYDNQFWNRTAKDLAMASTRSLGWNLGTIREIGGGVKDALKQGVRLSTGQKAEVTHRMAYTMALPIVVGFWGAMYHYLSTGKAPASDKDYFFPVGPDGNRVSFPTYMKDIYAWQHHPLQTAEHKINPAITATWEMLNNRDFYGNEIRNQDDPLVEQAWQIAKHAGKQLIPLSARNWMQSKKEGAGQVQRAESFFGITPAPSYINHSEAYNKALEYSMNNRGEGTRTTEQAERRDARQDVERGLRQGKLTVDQVREKIRNGEISPEDAKQAYQASKHDPLLKVFQGLPLEEALNVWDVATPEERKVLLPALGRKGVQLRARTGEDREALKARWLEALGRKSAADREPQVVPVGDYQ